MKKPKPGNGRGKNLIGERRAVTLTLIVTLTRPVTLTLITYPNLRTTLVGCSIIVLLYSRDKAYP